MNIYSLLLYAKDLLRAMYAAVLCPQYCVLCKKESNRGIPLCNACIKIKFGRYLFSIYDFDAENIHIGNNNERCFQCGRILISEQNLCTGCRIAVEAKSQLFCTHTICLFPYIGLGQQILPLWKNNSIRSFASVFAPLVHSVIIHRAELQGIPIVPVPPRPQKMRTKGWDQIEDICRYLQTYPDISILRCLKRMDGIPQKQLSKAARRYSLQDKIKLKASVHSLPERLIVFDDVRTTGATLEQCAHVLCQNGCKYVYGVCLFFD